MQYSNLAGEILMEKRNKFIHCKNSENRKAFLREIVSHYKASIDSDGPIAVYINDRGLPEPNAITKPDKVAYIHYEYYQYLVFLNIAKTIYSQIDSDELNKRIKHFLNGVNYTFNITKKGFTTFEEIIKMLEVHKEMFYSKYIEYLRTGIYNEEIREYPMNSLVMSCLIKLLKRDLGIKSYFGIIFDCEEPISVYSQMAINNLIYSTKYFNNNMVVKVVCPKSDWKTYEDYYGFSIEQMHNFNSCYIDNYLKKIRIK